MTISSLCYQFEQQLSHEGNNFKVCSSFVNYMGDNYFFVDYERFCCSDEKEFLFNRGYKRVRGALNYSLLLRLVYNEDKIKGLVDYSNLPDGFAEFM